MFLIRLHSVVLFIFVTMPKLSSLVENDVFRFSLVLLVLSEHLVVFISEI